LPGPDKIIFDEHTEELEAGDFLHVSSVDVYGSVTPPSLPEVQDHLLSIADLEREVVAKSLTSSLSGLIMIRPKMVVSSTNFRLVSEPCVATQSYVNRAYRSGLSMHP